MYPIRFKPVYRTYTWGGDRIASLFSRKISEKKVAEGWEISDRDEGMSYCINGFLKQKSLHEIVQTMREDLLGKGRGFSRFPILTKIIDAKENLSVQVHPDAISAPQLGGEPKAEMWVALNRASVYVGLKKKVGEKQFLKAIEQKKVKQLLNRFDLKKEESIFLFGGSVHAICAGSLIYEIQQNSNTTYRLYDWGRGRDLHLEKGMRAIRWDHQTTQKIESRLEVSNLIYENQNHRRSLLVSCEFFLFEKIDVFSELHLTPTVNSFQIFFCLEGEALLSVDGNEEFLSFGVSYLVPAACKTIDIEGKCKILRIRLP